MTDLFSLSDLNTAVNHEPRLMDLVLAERLGFERPRDIRKIIERNMEELTTYGTCATVSRVIRGNDAKEYYLNEGQALLICALSKTKQAAKVRKALIDVFMQHRRGEMKKELPTPTRQAALAQYPYSPAQVFDRGLEQAINRQAHYLALSAFSDIRRELKRQISSLMEMGQPVNIDALTIEITSPADTSMAVPDDLWQDVVETFGKMIKQPTARNLRAFKAAMHQFEGWDEQLNDHNLH